MTIETKYNIGEEVWFMYRNKVFSGRIVGIFLKTNGINYKIVSIIKGMWFSETKLFPTKEELLKSL